MKAILLNDTTRNLNHLGCFLVMQNIHDACAQHGIEILASFQDEDAYKHADFIKIIRNADIVLINGEGTMHHDQSYAIELLKTALVCKQQGLPIILLNTVWQENVILNDYIGTFDKIYVRESLSGEAVAAAGATCTVVPDMSFYNPEQISLTSKKPPRKLLVVDSVLPRKTRKLFIFALKNRTLLHCMRSRILLALHPVALLLQRYNLIPYRILTDKSFHRVTGVITGRFHAMCLSMKKGIPFHVLKSNSHKVQGVLRDAGITHDKYIIDVDDLKTYQGHPSFTLDDQAKIANYVAQAPQRINNMFSEIVTQFSTK